MAIYRILSIFADMEHEAIVTRTRAGLNAARARGVRLGRQPKLSLDDMNAVMALVASGEKPEAIAARYGVGRSTLFRHIKATR